MNITHIEITPLSYLQLKANYIVIHLLLQEAERRIDALCETFDDPLCETAERAINALTAEIGLDALRAAQTTAEDALIDAALSIVKEQATDAQKAIIAEIEGEVYKLGRVRWALIERAMRLG